ncbi:hypothetical protein KCP76_14015 [Salmonella enterica subsp. enterica serovar Weltevreden]|nr:hypothetical protein KCP76_14015 [Salmonella enterica subsp. enterica serovar Weltevreden]
MRVVTPVVTCWRKPTVETAISAVVKQAVIVDCAKKNRSYRCRLVAAICYHCASHAWPVWHTPAPASPLSRRRLRFARVDFKLRAIANPAGFDGRIAVIAVQICLPIVRRHQLRRHRAARSTEQPGKINDWLRVTRVAWHVVLVLTAHARSKSASNAPDRYGSSVNV